MTLSYIAVLIITALIFLFLLILLAFQPKVIARLNGIFIAFSATAGIVLYGYGYITI